MIALMALSRQVVASHRDKLGLITIGLLLLTCQVGLVALIGFPGLILPLLAVAAAAGLSSVAGFAFSAVSQALLAPMMHDPIRLVQILMICSIATQSFAIASLWKHMEWRRLPIYLGGGVLGLPVGVSLLLHLNRGGFQVAIGTLLFVYGTYVLVKRPIVLPHVGWLGDVAIGFLGGITGGLAAFPGAAITIWCSMKGWDKARQRGVYQPFILAMQFMALVTIALMRSSAANATVGGPSILETGLIFAPGTLIGSWFGLHIFHRISDRGFERTLAVLLMFAGVVMAIR